MNAVFEHAHLLAPALQQVRTAFDADNGVQWTYMNPTGRPCFNQALLLELLHHYESIEASGLGVGLADPGERSAAVRYDVLCSDHESAFNLGGDLDLFAQLIERNERAGLAAYAKLCIENIWNRLRRYGRDITTIALVQGKALGGGMEAAIASDFVIAERSAQLGLPEVLFNLFPGMGAYSILSRRLGARQAEELIASGKLFSAQELHDIGVVHILAEDGAGEAAVGEFVREHARRANAKRALARCRDIVQPTTHEELAAIADTWVDAALRLEARDLKMMQRLVASQNKLAAASHPLKEEFAPRQAAMA
jgi:DSF synthase